MMILCFCKYLIINGGVKRSILKTRYIDSIRIINESGLYSLILSSKLESAKRFKKWITSEVLPSIRKTGEYKTSSGGKGILVPDFSNPADAARAWADQYEAAQKAIAEKSQAEAEKQQALKTIEEHKPELTHGLGSPFRVRVLSFLR